MRIPSPKKQLDGASHYGPLTPGFTTVASPNPPTLTQWILDTRQGDENAAGLLLEAILPTIRKIVMARSQNSPHQDDLIQETIIKVFRNLDRYAALVPFERWVVRIAVNTCNDAYRRQSRRPELRMADMSEKAEEYLLASTTDRLSQKAPSSSIAAKNLIEELLSCLNPTDRQIVELICISGYSYHEASDLFGWNLSRVKVRLFRARQKLKEKMLSLSQCSPQATEVESTFQRLLAEAA